MSENQYEPIPDDNEAAQRVINALTNTPAVPHLNIICDIEASTEWLADTLNHFFALHKVRAIVINPEALGSSVITEVAHSKDILVFFNQAFSNIELPQDNVYNDDAIRLIQGSAAKTAQLASGVCPYDPKNPTLIIIADDTLTVTEENAFLEMDKPTLCMKWLKESKNDEYYMAFPPFVISDVDMSRQPIRTIRLYRNNR